MIPDGLLEKLKATSCREPLISFKRRPLLTIYGSIVGSTTVRTRHG